MAIAYFAVVSELVETHRYSDPFFSGTAPKCVSELVETHRYSDKIGMGIRKLEALAELFIRLLGELHDEQIAAHIERYLVRKRPQQHEP